MLKSILFPVFEFQLLKKQGKNNLSKRRIMDLYFQCSKNERCIWY